MIRLTREQVREIDRRAMEDYHIPGIVLMENASRAAAEAAEPFLPAHGVAILCGGGNNGGDGLAIARHLHNRGHKVAIVFGTDPDRLKGDALVQWRIVQAMRLPAFYFDPTNESTGVLVLREAGLIVDALFGTGLADPPREDAVPLIEACNEGALFQRPVLAVDVPSGLDCNTGRPLGACVRATRTITFVAEKTGFAAEEARQYLGEVVIGDIGCPKELIEAVASAPAN
jgi:NAD(P)H-hydrate epimerase